MEEDKLCQGGRRRRRRGGCSGRGSEIGRGMRGGTIGGLLMLLALWAEGDLELPPGYGRWAGMELRPSECV